MSSGEPWRCLESRADDGRAVPRSAASIEGRQLPKRVGSVHRGSAASIEGRHRP